MAKMVFARLLRIVGAVVAVFGGFFFILTIAGDFTPSLKGGGSVMEGAMVLVTFFLIFVFGLLCYWASAKLLNIPLVQDKNSGRSIHWGRTMAVLAVPVLAFLYIFAAGFGLIKY